MNMALLIAIIFGCLITFQAPCQSLPFSMPDKESVEKIRSAVISTSKGDFLVELYPDTAPTHVANLKFLADKDFYKGLTFHLAQDDYIVQGGDPTGSGNGGPGYNLLPEFSNRKHVRGTVGMSRRSDDINPQRLSNGSQFHILLRDAPHMDHKYTIIGQVVDGMDVVDRLSVGDTIQSIKVFVKK